jgi:16S rRNA (cytosine967-C5)-methyltransferase
LQLIDWHYASVSAEKPRQIAARILMRHAEGAGYIETLLDEALTAAGLSGADRALVQELAYGVVRWQATLEWLITRKTAGRPQKPALQVLLKLGLYQIFWMNRVPDHAAVHETVQLARDFGLGAKAGFVNAVLRGYLRDRTGTEQALRHLKKTKPAVGYSHPEWLIERWRRRWNEEEIRALLEWNNTPPPTYARRNSLRVTPEELKARWEEEGVQFVGREFDWAKNEVVFELKSHPPITSLPSFQKGMFYIQDPSTLLSVHALNPRPGDSVLDLCAAPGGKTTYIAQQMQNRGYIMAQDLDVRRREMIRANCDRLGVTIANIARATGTVNLELSEPFDRVLVDAPCSNSGVMRRRVDLRWRIQPPELERLRTIQADLLHRSFLQLKSGGVLVYSTCSLEPEENSSVVQQFLAEHPAFRLDHEREILPFREGVDGAYVARLVRVTP